MARLKRTAWRRTTIGVAVAALIVGGSIAQHVASAGPAQSAADLPGIVDAQTGTGASATNPDQQCPAVFGVVGSSHTDGGYPVSGQISDDGDNVRGTFMRHDNVVDTSWAYYATKDRYVTLDGGWALGGSTVESLSNKIEPWMFQDGSYAVLLAGTVDNMPEHMLSPEESMQHWPKLVEQTGLPPERILVVNLPPMNHLEDNILAYNEALAEFADEAGVRVFDMHAITSDGREWLPGYTVDGAHFQPEVGEMVGQAIADTINEMSGCVSADFARTADRAGLGEPIGSVEMGLADGGKLQHFSRGVVVASPTTTVALPEPVAAEWFDQDQQDGVLGYPISPAHCDENDCVQYFQGGRIDFDQATGTASSHER